VFLAGAVLLISGATPAMDQRMSFLSDFLPLSVLELSHSRQCHWCRIADSCAGTFRRVDASWWMTLCAARRRRGRFALLKGNRLRRSEPAGVRHDLLWVFAPAASSPRTAVRAGVFPRPGYRIAAVVAADWLGLNRLPERAVAPPCGGVRLRRRRAALVARERGDGG